MISRIVMAVALVAGTVAIHATAQAQTGVTAQDAVNSGAASPTGSVGTTSNTSRDNSSSTSTTMGSMGGGTTNSPGTAGAATSSSGTASAATGSAGTAGTATGGRAAMNTHATSAHGRIPARHATHRGTSTDVAERQVTECLNNAASKGAAMDSCKR